MASKKFKKYTIYLQAAAFFKTSSAQARLCSHNFHPLVDNSEILSAISNKKSALFGSVQHFSISNISKRFTLMKFYHFMGFISLDMIHKYVGNTQQVKEQLNSQIQFCKQTKWEILKYEIYHFTINFPKDLAQLRIHT